MLHRLVTVIFWLVFFLQLFLAPLSAQARTAFVTAVIDGDTFALQSGEKVRVMGIDTPERGEDAKTTGYFFQEAKDALSSLISHREVELKRASKDRYGRILSLVETAEGDVGEIMVRRGFAWYYPHSDHPMSLGAKLLLAQREAMENRAGLWEGFFSWARKQGPVVGNRKSWRYFPPEAPVLGRIHPGNRLEFSNPVKAFWAGFVPARGYNQWPSVSDIFGRERKDLPVKNEGKFVK